MERRIAFVTGASRGIGAATALRLAQQGFDLVLTARTLVPGERHDHGQGTAPGERHDHGQGAASDERHDRGQGAASDERPLPGSLEETAAAVRGRGREALALGADLLEPDQLAAALDETERRWGPVEVLVNNGIVQTAGAMDRVADLAGSDLLRIYRGNVLAPLQLVQRVLPGMLARGSGTIVNLVSQAGFSDPPAPTGEGGWGFAYASSKAALGRLVGVLAAEHRDTGLRLFNVEPGFIVTELVRETGLLEQFGSQWRGAPPDVPAAVIAWLASEDAARAWHGKTVFAQKLCAELDLVPGWPGEPEPRGGD